MFPTSRWRDPEREPGLTSGACSGPLWMLLTIHSTDKLSPLSHLGQLEGEHENGRRGPDSPDTQASGPLAGTVRRLLHCVGHPGGIGGTEELHRATLQSHLTAALAEAGIRVDVVVVNAGRRAPPITRHQVHLENEHVSKAARGRSASPSPPPPEITIPHSLHPPPEIPIHSRTGVLLLQSFLRMVMRMVTFLQERPSSLPVCKSYAPDWHQNGPAWYPHINVPFHQGETLQPNALDK